MVFFMLVGATHLFNINIDDIGERATYILIGILMADGAVLIFSFCWLYCWGDGVMRETRWMIRRDLDEVIEIERLSFPVPWTEEDFLSCLRTRNVVGMVCEDKRRIIGHMLYELHKSSLHLVNFAVHPDHRRDGVGASMVHRLTTKLVEQRREEIVLEVRETNLSAQLFFRSQGFRAVGTMKSWYDGDDAYMMRYRLDEAFMPVNRMAQYFGELRDAWILDCIGGCAADCEFLLRAGSACKRSVLTNPDGER
jgi:[ribosomal protein S18]-alanine N-acetyltransferase